MDAEETLMEPEEVLYRIMGSEEDLRLRLRTHLDVIGLAHLIES